MTTGLSNGVRTRALSPISQSVVTGIKSNAVPSFTGKTLSNILGDYFNCEATTGITTSGTVATSTTQFKTGTKSLKVTASAGTAFFYKDYTYTLDSTKNYIVAGWAYLESYSAGAAYITLSNVGTYTAKYTCTINTGTVGSWQFVYAKVPTSNTLVGTGFRLVAGATTAGSTLVAYIDSIRLYEVDATLYSQIGSTYTASTTPSIDAILPYVDNVKHVVNPYINQTGTGSTSFSSTTTLASSLNGSVADTLTLINGTWTKTKNLATDVTLDGSQSWSQQQSNTGNKVFKVSLTGVDYSQIATKSNSIMLRQNTGAVTTYASDDCALSSNTFYVAVGSTDSGFGDSFSPSVAEIQAYFYGYKMNNGTFGTAYNGTGTKTWTLWNATSNTGSVTTVPTSLASGFVSYKISYQLATPTTETPTTTNTLQLDANTTNTVDVGASSGTSAANKYSVTCNPVSVSLKFNIDSGIGGFGKLGRVKKVGTGLIPPKI
jgi:hypothetical protein